ncbi:MAG: arylamine N-acetyltransferase [Coriobacteriia bacterium]|nr:arylamine N-acetyltransferase [Coriobacteriia bacterium]
MAAHTWFYKFVGIFISLVLVLTMAPAMAVAEQGVHTQSLEGQQAVEGSLAEREPADNEQDEDVSVTLEEEAPQADEITQTVVPDEESSSNDIIPLEPIEPVKPIEPTKPPEATKPTNSTKPLPNTANPVDAAEQTQAVQDEEFIPLGILEQSARIEGEQLIDTQSLSAAATIRYRAHVQSIGWQKTVSNGALAGTSGRALRMEALEISLGGNLQGSVNYSAHVQSIGWQRKTSNGGLAGTSGRSLRLEAIRINLSGAVANNYDVYYRVHAQSIGWMGWACNDQPAGTAGRSLRLEAVEIKLVPKGNQAPGSTVDSFIEDLIKYQAHVSKVGWQAARVNSQVAGVIGQSNRVEALRVQLASSIYSGGISYSTYVQRSGWKSSVSNGQVGGTTGQALSLQAIKIKLTGEIASQHDVCYRVNVAGMGWLSWTMNDKPAGTLGYDRAIEAVQIRLTPKGQSSFSGKDAYRVFKNISYQSHVSGIGWQRPVGGGSLSGTTGQGKRVEAFSVILGDTSLDSTISYQSYLANRGWQDAVSNGATSGTTGQSLPIEAIRASLIGSYAEEFDLYYRVYVSHYGWLAWATDGKTAGVIGCTRQVEAIEMRLVPKGKNAPDSGKATNASLIVSFGTQAFSSGLGWIDPTNAGRKIVGTTGQSRKLEAFKLWWRNTSSYQGGIEYSSHVSGIGWQDSVQDEAVSGTTGQKRQIEAVRIKLTGAMAKNFDVYYRASVMGFGWTGWARNGQDAGSTGRGLAMEAFEIALVPKGATAPGSTKNATLQSLTGDQWLDAQLQRIAAANGNDLRSCFNHVLTYPYVTMSLWPTGAWEIPFAKEMIQRGAGNCYRYAALFCMLARQLGYDARVVTGRVASASQGLQPHGWVEIHRNGQVYVCDPSFGRHVVGYNWYMVTYANAPITYHR